MAARAGPRPPGHWHTHRSATSIVCPSDSGARAPAAGATHQAAGLRERLGGQVGADGGACPRTWCPGKVAALVQAPRRRAGPCSGAAGNILAAAGNFWDRNPCLRARQLCEAALSGNSRDTPGPSRSRAEAGSQRVRCLLELGSKCYTSKSDCSAGWSSSAESVPTEDTGCMHPERAQEECSRRRGRAGARERGSEGALGKGGERERNREPTERARERAREKEREKARE